MVERLCAVALCLAFCCSALARNLVINPDFSEDDGLGGILGWSHETYADGAVRVRRMQGGVASVEFDGKARSHWHQLPVKLAPKRKYRLKADVRTSGLGCARVQLLVRHWDRNWRADVGTPPFPDNTHGKWHTVEWTGELKRSADTDAYIISIAGTGGSNCTAKVEMRKLSLSPLRNVEGYEDMGLAPGLSRPFVARIVPIDPLLSHVDAESGKMMFYWPGEPKGGIRSCSLTAVLDGGRRIESSLGADGRAELAFGRIEEGRHRIELKVMSADGIALTENSYEITARRKVLDGPKGKRLNNFVVQLVDKPLSDGCLKFFVPERGWVWVSFDGCNTALGFIDSERTPAVRRRVGERHVEAMRDMEGGWHELKVQGANGGRLRIHAIKTVSTCTWLVNDAPCRFSEGKHQLSHGFVRRFLMSMNTVRGAENAIRDPNRREVPYYKERGYAVYDRVSISTDSLLWLQPEEQFQKLTETGWSKGYDISVDEALIDTGRAKHVIFSENVWKMHSKRPAQRVNINWGDADSRWYDDPKVHTSLLSAIANTGDGRGVSLPEVYAPVLDSPDKIEKWLDVFAKQISAIGEMVPGARNMTQFNASPWVDLGRWSDYPCPETDIKAHYAKMFHAFAVRPEFAANSGIDAGAMFAADEELRRWIARLFRYYAIEGGTENLADLYGYGWNPGFVKNCDFAEGLSGWNAIPAGCNSLKAGYRRGYGSKVQCRKKAPAGTGDRFSEFVATDRGVNVLEQRISKLTLGKMYALIFCVADAEQLERPKSERDRLAFSARLEGAEEIPGLRFMHTVKSRYKAKGSGKKDGVWLTMYRYVFCAKSEVATLRFMDRADDGVKPVAGMKQILNYVIFRPYYTETPEEANEIAAIIAGENNKREMK